MKKSEENGSKYNIFSLLGWLFGGLSLLNLIEDLTPLTLLGKLKKWIDGYGLTVERIGDFIFGWISFKWISINHIETHLLVITLVIFSAVFRAEYKIEKMYGQYDSLLDAEILVLAINVAIIPSLFVLVPALLFPAWFGLAGAAIGFVFVCIVYVLPKDENTKYAGRESILQELVGVLIVFMFIVVLNYTVFQ